MMKKACLVEAVVVWNHHTARLRREFIMPDDQETYGQEWDAEIDRHLAHLGWTGVEVEEAILRR